MLKRILKKLNFLNAKKNGILPGSLFCLPNESIGSDIAIYGFYAKDEINMLTKFILLDKNPNKYFIDVGANIGNHSVALSSYFNNFILVEPSTTFCKVAEINCEFNNMNFSIHNTCVLPNKSKFTLVEPTGFNYGTGRVELIDNEIFSGDVKHATTMNELIEGIPSNFSIYVKLDIEGCEYPVLTINNKWLNNVVLVGFEWNSNSEVYSLADVVSVLSGRGFKLYFFSFKKNSRRVIDALFGIFNNEIMLDLEMTEFYHHDTQYPLIIATKLHE